MSADGASALTGPAANLRPWVKGQSGNPAGMSKARREVATLARAVCAESMEVIIELMRSSEDDKVRLAAAIEVKNTAIGKPRVRDLTKEEIEAEVDKRIRQLATQANEMRRAGALDVTPGRERTTVDDPAK